MKKIVFATQNENKAKEIQQVLPKEFQILTLKDLNFDEEIEENGGTIEENAQIKAKKIFHLFKLSCFADDSGLEIEALNGKPGIWSARYAGEEKDSQRNMDLVLAQMKNIDNRLAQFKTAIHYIDNNGEDKNFIGIIKGEITREKIGNQGFGYDPIFKPLGYDITFAQMSMTEKNKISHRALAFKQLIEFLS